MTVAELSLYVEPATAAQRDTSAAPAPWTERGATADQEPSVSRVAWYQTVPPCAPVTAKATLVASATEPSEPVRTYDWVALSQVDFRTTSGSSVPTLNDVLQNTREVQSESQR